MKCSTRISRLPRWVGIAGVTFLSAVPWFCQASEGDWREVSRTAGLAISVRDRGGNPIKELRAVGTIDAPTWVVKNVLDDVDSYPSFMPYTVEARLLNRDTAKRTATVYMKLDPPLVGPRDVTIRIQEQVSKAPDGNIIYNSHWEADNATGPAVQAGVTRMNLDEGSWTLEPTADGKSTRAIYSLLTDAGGNLPPFVVNMANKRSIADLFEAVRKQTQNGKYRQSQLATDSSS
ncbi:MAG: hypothetical protein JO015_05600 [Verrucomicrobia bacterium]|nr:hypothetical protein [Verrucomicrobiota bacterium]